MRTHLFDYDLPKELIAQTPIPRGESRLLVIERTSGAIRHKQFKDLSDYIHEGDTLVLNDTRVIARRLFGAREDGGMVEALMLRPAGEADWEALIKPGRRVRAGQSLRFMFGDGSVVEAEVVCSTPEGGRLLRFAGAETRDRILHEGVIPLPPYIRSTIADEDRYQTVYATGMNGHGSAAAPTAGLHFTDEMLAEVESRGVSCARVSLDVGVDTFRPVRTETLDEHVMHGERFVVSPEAARTINCTRGRIVAVGSTSVRVLESAAIGDHVVQPMEGETRLFIIPGHRFRAVDALLTNFHLPRSTLLALVSAFAGRELVLEAYRQALAERYRFFSFGDAMLIV